MTKNTLKSTLIFLPALLATTAAYSYGESMCCQSPLPLWSIGLEGGAMPTNYSSRGPLYRFNQTSPGFTTDSSYEFSRQFKTPYTVGAEISRYMSPVTNIFVEGNYIRGKGKVFNFTSSGTNISQTFDNFNSYAFYLGGRIFGNFCRSNFHPYIGAKVGVIHYNKTTAFEMFNNAPIPPEIDHFYPSNKTISGGVQVGLDYSITPALSLGAKVEVVASGARLPQVVANTPPAPNIFVGNTGTLISYPIELVLKYNFTCF